MERIFIGANADALSQRIAERRATNRIRARLASVEYQAMIQAARSVPVQERPGWTNTYEGNYHLDDVEGSLEALAEKEQRDFSRIISEPILQVRGSRRRVIRCVARWATWRLGKLIPDSCVDRCWKAYRSVNNEEHET